MKLWHAILVTFSLYVGINLEYLMTRHNVAWYVIILTTLWAAIDSSRIQLKRYRSGVGPVAFFLLCLLFWTVGFTWYLWMRGKIKAGTAELKTNDLRCVSCEELIDSGIRICPKCGWTQPVYEPVAKSK
ncbi:MAG TPA: hypothetical protein VK815_16115 [Candidatus Acidoferrales bacterium]|jgi:hypothetical protein|nr:hypothetical protein [Candidatus Acidoferrales bacterium]